jgi:trk system potassium uptake protein
MSLRSSRRLVPLRYTLRLTTPRLLVGGFAAVMALGTLLLKLPASTQDGISWINAFFVSVSAVSVTGLSTVDFPATFTSFGGAVVMGLIQVGGLGIMTLATLGALVVGNRVGFKSILSLREELGTIDSPLNTLTLVGRMIEMARSNLRNIPRP